jgi:hypothetical protein
MSCKGGVGKPHRNPLILYSPEMSCKRGVGKPHRNPLILYSPNGNAIEHIAYVPKIRSTLK